MISHYLHAFLRIDKQRNLTTLLWVMTFVVGLIGSKNEIATTVVVALLQLLFILAYSFSYRSFPAYHLLRQQVWLYRLFCAWSVVITLSYLKVFFADQEQQGFYQIAASVRQFTLFIHVLFVISVASFICHIRRSQSVLYEVMTSCCLLLVFYLYQILYAPVLNADIWFMGPPFAFHARLLGYLFVAAFAVALGAYFCAGSLLKRQGFLMLALVFLSMLVWLGGRASMLAALVCMLFIGVYALIQQRAAWSRLIVMLLMLPLAYLIAEPFMIFDWNGFEKVAQANLKDLSANAGQGINLNGLTTGRLQIWTEVLQGLKEDIWFGLGPNGYLFIPGHRFGFGIHPHNVFVQFLVEWGVMGSTLVILMLAILLWHLLRQFAIQLQRQHTASVTAAMVLIALSVNGLADGTFYHAQSLYYLTLGFALFPFFTGRDNAIG